MYKFGIPEYAILLVFLGLCVVWILLKRKKIQKRSSEISPLKKLWVGITFIFTGIVLIAFAIIFHNILRVDYNNTMEILKPVAQMTSQPVLLLTIIMSFTGITLSYTGIMYLRSR